VLVGGLLAWIFSYLLRALTQKMTYNQQIKDYQEAFLQKRLESLTPEELEKITAEIAQENSQPKP
jgi:Glu-tRNA(Gln) amidotransferase subunit E-like FAD-binding protein